MKNKLSLLLLSITFICFAQKEKPLLINSEIVKSILLNKTKQPKLIKIQNTEINFPIYKNDSLIENKKRFISLLTNSNVNPNTINGSFHLIEVKFKIVKESIPNLVIKNQICKEELINVLQESVPNYEQYLSSITYGYVLKSTENDEIYAINEKDYSFFLGLKEMKKNLEEKFTFYKPSLIHLEKLINSNKLGYLSSTPNLKKRCTGIFKIDSIHKNFDFEKLEHIKFSSISDKETFICLSNINDYENRKDESNIIIKNTKTQQLYLIMGYTFTYRKPSDFGNSKVNYGYTIKYNK